MADIIKSIITRIDTTANWTTRNPIPSNGEQCIEILKGGLFKLKVGDGQTPWVALKYETLGDGYEKFKSLLHQEVLKLEKTDNELKETKLDKTDEPLVLYGTNLDGEQITYKIDDVGKIDDVLVDDVSVVENKIAKINLTGKLDKTTEKSVVYGTDNNGEQTVYSKEDFGKVDDVQLNGKSLVVDKVANIEPVAEDVKYTNPAVSSITNIQEALDDLLNIHYYVNPAYSKFTITDANSYDVGDTATNPFTITWELNKQPKAGDTQTLSLDNTKIYDIMANSENLWKSGSYEYNTRDFTATSPKTFTFKIEYTDNHSTVPSGKTNKCNASKSFSFMYRRFWGVTDTETLTDEQIWAMNNELSTTRTQTRDFDCSGGKYWWIIIPTTYCSNISFVDVASGLPMTLPDSCINTRTIKNSFNVSYSVNTYRVEYKQTASSVKVKVN